MESEKCEGSGRAKVTILLASFNGETYIREQIKSIQAQTYPDWVLLVRDDGSSDNTKQIISEIAATDRRISLIVDERSTRPGVVANFSALMERAAEAGASYIMLADQDDVWMPDKIETLVRKISLVESEVRSGTPVLIHSDLEVVDAHLRGVSPSFLKYQGIKHERISPLRVLLSQNFVTGCTVLFNRAALDLALPVPADVVMHDWWIALVVAATGRVDFVSRPTVRYRQHGRNQVGAKPILHLLTSRDGEFLERLQRGDECFSAGIRQADHLICRLRERSMSIDEEIESIIRYYSTIGQAKRLARLATALRLRVGPQHWLRRLLFYARLLRLPVQVV